MNHFLQKTSNNNLKIKKKMETKSVLMPSEKVELEAKLYASEINLSKELPKLSEEIESYILDKVERAYFNGYSKSSSDNFKKFFELIQEIQNQKEEEKEEEKIEYQFHKIKLFVGISSKIQKQINDFFDDIEEDRDLKIISTQQSYVGDDIDGDAILAISIIYTTD